MSKKIVMPTKDEVKLFSNTDEDNKLVEPTKEDIKIFGVDIVADNSTSTNGGLYVVDRPKLVGAMPVRTEIEVLPKDPIGTISMGWTVTEVIGVGAYNARGINGYWLGDSDWQDRIEDMLSEDSEDEND